MFNKFQFENYKNNSKKNINNYYQNNNINNNVLLNSGINCLSYNDYKNKNNYKNNYLLTENKNNQINYNNYYNNNKYNYYNLLTDNNSPYKIEQKIQYQYLPKNKFNINNLDSIEKYKNEDLKEKNTINFSLKNIYTPRRYKRNLWYSSEYSSQYINYLDQLYGNISIISKPSNLIPYTNDMFRKRDANKDYKKPVYKFDDIGNLHKDINFMQYDYYNNDSLINDLSLNKSLSHKDSINSKKSLSNILNNNNINNNQIINDNNFNNSLNKSINKSILSNNSLKKKNDIGEEIICGIIEGTGNNAKKASQIEDFYVDGGNNEINIFKKKTKK